MENSTDKKILFTAEKLFAQKGFDAIQRATGLSKVEAIKHIQSSGMSLVEKRIQNLGNINNITKGDYYYGCSFNCFTCNFTYRPYWC